MAILKVTRMGHPVLRKKTRAVTAGEIRTPQVQKLIDDMVETMREYEGVGLAAPQVYESKSIVVMEMIVTPGKKSRSDIPLTILINPHYEPLTEEKEEGWEGCLSIPDLRGSVPRYEKIRVTGLDRKGNAVDFKATGFFAVVLQHEIDHLQGILYVDRMKDLKTLAFLKEHYKYWDKD